MDALPPKFPQAESGAAVRAERNPEYVGWRPLFDSLKAGLGHWREYAFVAIVLLGITAAGFFLLPSDYYQGLGFIYLLAVILLSLRVGQGAAFFAGIFSAAIWDFVFILPHWSFAIGKLSDALLWWPYFVVVLVLSQVAVFIRNQTRREKTREQRATALFLLTRALAAARSLDEAAANSLRQLDELLNAQTALALTGEKDGLLQLHPINSYALEGVERSVAELVLTLRRPAGRFTETSPEVRGYYLPLLRDDRVVGVLGVQVPETATLTLRQRELLDAFARQLALIVEREHLRAAGEREKLLAESAKLHRALLESVSHELRTPLAVITVALDNLRGADDELRAQVLAEARTAAKRLNRVVGNLLDQTRLESGALKPRLNWCDARDIINAAHESARDALAGRQVTIAVPRNFSPLRADFALMEQALANLLFNAAQHTPPGAPVTIAAGLAADGGRVFFEVADRGAGFSPELRENVFQKFTRGDAAKAGGLGLGLSLVRGFILAQGGEVVVDENPGGGARITLYLPHVAAENPPPE